MEKRRLKMHEKYISSKQPPGQQFSSFSNVFNIVGQEVYQKFDKNIIKTFQISATVCVKLSKFLIKNCIKIFGEAS